MKINKIIDLSKEQKWRQGSIWEFDLYISQIFVEVMAFGNYPIPIKYFQPVLNDEFLNTKLNDNLLERFKNLLNNHAKIKKVIKNQEAILSTAKNLLKNIKNNSHYFDYKKYEITQRDLSLLMASVSTVFDPLISDLVETIGQETKIPTNSISSYIIDKSRTVTALNESNKKLTKLYLQNKSTFEKFFSSQTKLNPNLKQLLKEHSHKYGWINTGEKSRQKWTESDFLQQLKELKNTQKSKVKIPNKIKPLLKYFIKININDNIAADLQVELDFYFQEYLKNKFKNQYHEQIFENLTLKEIENLDKNNKPPQKYSNRINQPKLIFPYKGSAKVKWLTPNEFKLLKKNIIRNKAKHKNTKITGRVAYTGLVEGKAKIVKNQKDLNNFKKGYILVAEKTQPSYVIAMKKATAIVTDIGGITSHAAIISRELNIPCIVATESATKLIKNDDLIRVNAEKGIVEILEKNS